MMQIQMHLQMLTPALMLTRELIIMLIILVMLRRPIPR